MFEWSNVWMVECSNDRIVQLFVQKDLSLNMIKCSNSRMLDWSNDFEHF